MPGILPDSIRCLPDLKILSNWPFSNNNASSFSWTIIWEPIVIVFTGDFHKRKSELDSFCMVDIGILDFFRLLYSIGPEKGGYKRYVYFRKYLKNKIVQK